jgi:hypothetical protein
MPSEPPYYIWLTPKERESLATGAAGGASLGAVFGLVASSTATIAMAPVITGVLGGAILGAGVGHLINWAQTKKADPPGSSGE